LRRLYDANKDQYRMPERVKVRHILLKTTDKPKEELPKIRAKAEDLLKQVNSGGDFAELAKKNSEDPGSAVQGGDLGWIVRGQTVPNFENAAFSLKPKQISGIITTEYGFHIIQVMEKEDARVKPFEEVKDQIANERKKQQVYDTMQRLADQSHDLLVKSPSSGQQIAQQLGATFVHVDKAGAGDPVPEFGVNPDFEATVAGLPKGGVTPVMQAQGNKLAVAAVTDILPARQAELSEVENQIRGDLVSQKLASYLVQKANEAAQKAKEFNGDLKKLAQSMGLEVKTTQEFTRGGAADGIGPAGAVLQAFSQPTGAIFGPVNVEQNRFICKVDSKTPADMSKLAEQRQALTSEIKMRKARERTELFQDSLRTSLIRDGKIKIHQEVINRILESYRS
jgi:peptidyl-prolyl cis-trans isomerase D